MGGRGRDKLGGRGAKDLEDGRGEMSRARVDIAAGASWLLGRGPLAVASLARRREPQTCLIFAAHFAGSSAPRSAASGGQPVTARGEARVWGRNRALPPRIPAGHHHRALKPSLLRRPPKSRRAA